jgi:hypothetical protein
MSFRLLMLAGALAACIPAAPSGRLLAASAPGATAIGPAVRRVRLLPACGPDGRGIDLAARLAAGRGRRVLLVFEDLRAGAQPGVLFDLRLGTGRAAGGAVIGTLNFFAAQKPGMAARPRVVSYDVTRAVRALAAEGGIAGGLVLSVQPAGVSEPRAKASVGRIALVEP